jgi:hypothetical protein
MNTILTYLISFYLLPTFIVIGFFKFYIQLIKTQWKHVSFHNDFFKKKIEPTFLCSYLNFGFGWMYFLVCFTILDH